MVMMKCLYQLLPSPHLVIVGLTFFTFVVEAKLGESHINNDRRLQGNMSGRYPLNVCQGDCDVDEHCRGNLICFQRNGFDPVPGCHGGDRDRSTTDYCIDPRFILPELKWLGRNPEAWRFPLQECEGDCDRNSDCAAGLVCLQRRHENSGPVLGCSGRDDDLTDYCVKSSLVYPNGQPQSAESPSSNPPRPNESTTTTSPPPNARPQSAQSPSSNPLRPDGSAIASSRPQNQFEVIQDFGLKMYWEPQYMWQEENFDRRWCMECRDGKCDYGDKTYINTCNPSISQRYDFIAVNDNGSTMIRLHGTDLCFERISMDIFLYTCDPSNRRQRWVGDFRRDRFEIKPYGLHSHCVTQRHHPKFFEEVEIELCHTARSSLTSYWTRYR